MKHKYFLAGLLLLISIVVNAQQWGYYTLYAPRQDTRAYLIDTANTPGTYKTWNFSSQKKTGYSAYLLPGDTLLRTYKLTTTSFNSGGITGGVQKVDWNGNIIWDYTYSSTTYCIHHDICPLPNGNVLMISIDKKTATDASAAGSTSSDTFYSEKIIEVKPVFPNGGVIVWEWKLWDHMCQNADPEKDNYVESIQDNPQLMNINYSGTGMLPDRYHMNGLDYNAELDQIVFSMHFMNSVFIIDHSTTTAEAAGHTGGNSGKGGDFLYRWGNPSSYGVSGTTAFSTVHDAHWVPADNPNYPDYLCAYNNQGGAGNKTCIDIWLPPYDGYNYSHVAGEAYLPATYAYRYTSTFSATNEGNSQQLPNGNMMVNNSFGNIYEINSSGTNLWTKNGAQSSHAYRYTKCYVRGPVASAGSSTTSLCQGEQLNLSASALSVTETNPTYSYAWSSENGFTSGLQNPVLSPNQTDTYSVTITNTALGCSDTASVTVIVSACNSSENTNALLPGFYPNPATEKVFATPGNYQPEQLKIVVSDIAGRKLYEASYSPETDVSDWPDGAYFFMFYMESQPVHTSKIIVSHQY